MNKILKAILIGGVLILCIPAFIFTVAIGIVKNFIDAVKGTYAEFMLELPSLGESIKDVWNA